MKVLFATTNPAKVRKYSDELNKKNIDLLTIKDLNMNLKIDENGKNALENAYIKAKTYYDATGIVSIAAPRSSAMVFRAIVPGNDCAGVRFSGL